MEGERQDRRQEEGLRWRVRHQVELHPFHRDVMSEHPLGLSGLGGSFSRGGVGEGGPAGGNGRCGVFILTSAQTHLILCGADSDDVPFANRTLSSCYVL